MTSIQSVFDQYSRTALSGRLHDSTWAFPAIEVFHLISLAALLGMILLMNLHILGLVLPKISYRDLARQFSPAIGVCLTIMVITGVLLTGTDPLKYYGNEYYRAKLLLFTVALVVHFFLDWDRRRQGDSRLSLWRRASAGLSLGLWLSVGIAGRAIGLF